ncbi:MAG: alpha/beta hydrolase family protein [Thermoanaerobaculia bacterium]
MKLVSRLLTTVIAFSIAASGFAQSAEPAPPPRRDPAIDRSFEQAIKRADDLLWYYKLSDIATVNKYRIPSTKPARTKKPNEPGAGNPLIFQVYVFTPKNLKGRAPLIVWPHGGVHGDHNSTMSHITRELIEEGYVIVAPEYRGSTGYGSEMYKQIDYGGAEIDDTKAARDWAVEFLPEVDPKRVGIIGWSHGGFHALMNIFNWPDDYDVCYAGVPVSDLVQRMGYTGQEYRDIFEEFIGDQPEDNPMEYRKRSPVYHASKLETPLLIHTNTNDEDVNVMEVEHLIAALKAAGKKFEYKIYQNEPGGHHFNRIDTLKAKQSRREVYEFLAKYLK